ncbi:DoxX family protein [Pseudoflavitalea rhizosphaerae]|uniref:DoxX family protein n=1 Tax=Pseudoflavitalea rhizosphaerae TaxID=1884793 RepID=UPI000F8EED7C|nr:DoxX family protein [Pseudoflavitalea rhizosphaerae]
MSKRNKIIYWIATVWLALGMVSTGIVQLMQAEKEVALMLKLGYPNYFLMTLGVWKLLGSVVVLMPKFPLLKEWAYAGFFFTTTGAIVSHLASGAEITETFPALLLLVLTVVSWYFRPAGRKVADAA